MRDSRKAFRCVSAEQVEQKALKKSFIFFLSFQQKLHSIPLWMYVSSSRYIIWCQLYMYIWLGLMPPKNHLQWKLRFSLIKYMWYTISFIQFFPYNGENDTNGTTTEHLSNFRTWMCVCATMCALHTLVNLTI